MGLASIIVSIFSLAFSLFFYLKHERKLNLQQRELNRQQEQINNDILSKIESEKTKKSKADIYLEFYRDGRKIVLKIHNRGISDAKNIRISDTENLTKNLRYKIFPYQILKPDGEIEDWFGLSKRLPQNTEITLLWDDDNKADNKTTSIVYL